MQPGDEITDFELPDQTGTPRRLSTMLADGPVVLFFYPMAMTKGCTAEACHFRDLAGEFADVGAQRVGISLDAVEKQKQFSDKHDFDYPLLADTPVDTPPMSSRKKADRPSRRRWKGNCGRPMGSTATSGVPSAALNATTSRTSEHNALRGNSTVAISRRRRKAITPRRLYGAAFFHGRSGERVSL